ncbi:MAG: flippase [Candidatus Kapabacteria bacterium]|nr:flippase [Candidatus Kapabacteria bacterium]MDW7996484.1 flippase [Bacteroidota bacterium]MDW8225255.1 flippase [Bacteroidota bacterium]
MNLHEGKPHTDAPQRSAVTHLQRIARNAGITAGGSLFGQLLGPVIGVITTRALGAELYGVYALLVQWGAFAAEVAKAGFGAALVRFVGIYRARGQIERLKGAIQAGIGWAGLIGTSIAVLVAVLAEPIGGWLVRHPEAASAIRLYAPAVALTALYGITLAVLTGFQQQRFVQLSSAVVGNLVKLGSLVLLLGTGLQLYAALVSSLVQDVVVLILSGFFLLRVFPEMRSAVVPGRAEWSSLIPYALTIFATSLFYRYTFQLDVLMLGLFRTAAEVGLYAAALRLQPLLALPTYAIGETFNPVVAELYARDDKSSLRVVYSSAVRWSLLLTFPPMLLLVMLPEAVLSVFGTEFQGAAPALRLLSVGTWLGVAFGVAGYVLNMAGKPQVNLINGLVTAGLNLSLFLLLIPRFGMVGAALAYAAVNVGMAFVRVGQVWWLLRLHPWEAALGRSIILVGSALTGAFAAQIVAPWVGTLLGLAIFGVFFRIGLSSHDRELWAQWRARRKSGAEG